VLLEPFQQLEHARHAIVAGGQHLERLVEARSRALMQRKDRRRVALSQFNLETAVDRSPPLEVWRPTTTCAHDGPQAAGETATHPIEPPSATLAALRILAMAHAIAAVRALPARPMTARSGASNCRF
jgi:hypothetical protein